MYVIDPLEIPGVMRDEGLDVWVCSFGGSGTNMLANYLETKGLRVRTPSWDALLCHHSRPIDVQHDVRAVYLFSDPFKAFRSQKRREYLDANFQKFNNDPRAAPSDDAFFSCMMAQFTNWTERNRTNLPILVVRLETLFDTGKHALGDFLGISVHDFPVEKARVSTDLEIPAELELRRRHSEVMARLDAFPPSRLRRASLRAQLKARIRDATRSSRRS